MSPEDSYAQQADDREARLTASLGPKQTPGHLPDPDPEPDEAKAPQPEHQPWADGPAPEEPVDFVEGWAEPGDEPDMVDHPPHYNFSDLEPIDVIEQWGLGFHEGNALKYIARAKHKGSELQDLKKAAWYLLRLIEVKEGTAPGGG